MSKFGAHFAETVDRVRNEPGLGRNVLIIVGLMVLGVAVGSYILGNQRFNPPWEDSTFVWATFTEAPAVAPGNGQEVRVAGVPVGEIREDRISADGHAELLLAIDRERYDKPIYDNATIVLRPKSPLNEMYITINPGGPPGKPLPEEGVLPAGNTRPPVPIDQSLAHLDANTQEALQALLSASDVALARAPHDLPQGLRAAEQVMKDLRPVMEELDIRRGRLSEMITSVSQLSTALGADDARLATLARSLQRTLATVSHRSADLRSSVNHFPGFFGDLTTATGRVQKLSAELDPTLDEIRHASTTLPGSLNAVTGTVRRFDDTMDRALPVARKLVPFAGDFRPFVADLGRSLVDAKAITARLDHFTGGSVPYLTDLQAFVYQTNSVISLGDANGAILRGLLRIGPTTVPLPGVAEKSPTPR